MMMKITENFQLLYLKSFSGIKLNQCRYLIASNENITVEYVV